MCGAGYDHCVCVAGVYFDGTCSHGPLRGASASSHAIARSTLAALRSHRIPARWSHWTGPPFILFYLFFSYPPSGARTRYMHARIRSAQWCCCTAYAYSFVHIRSRERAHSTASVCASVAFSFLFLAVRSAAAGLHYSHDQRHSVVV